MLVDLTDGGVCISTFLMLNGFWEEITARNEARKILPAPFNRTLACVMDSLATYSAITLTLRLKMSYPRMYYSFTAA